MASKPAVKTYSRSHARETVATRAFDEAFSAKQNAAAVPIKAAPTKWGKTSFCRVRDDDPFETTYKKVKIENETVDPFTFDYDDEGGQIKLEPVITPSAPSSSTTSNNGNTGTGNQQGMTFGGLGRPAIPNMKVQKTAAPVVPIVVVENEENETVVESQPSFRRPIRTYSRASKREQPQVSDQQVSLAEPMEAETSVYSEPATQESDVFSSQERPSRVNEDIFGDDDDDEPPPVLKKETPRTSRNKEPAQEDESAKESQEIKSEEKTPVSPSKAVYNVRSWQADFDEEDRSGSSSDESQPPKLQPITKQVPQFEEDDKQAEPPRLVRAMHWPKQDDAYTSVHVTKQHKELYTVVKNVKEAHECQEYGETQEYIDDVEYLLAGLQDKQPMSTRCLSCIGIAQKCIIPAFRMHLRAHGIITKIFGSVQDACSDPSLALCTSLVMFMLSRDRLNMDLDDQSVTLMLSLLGVDNQEISASMTAAGKRALNRNKDRVKEVYEQLQKELQKEGKPKLPELEFVSTGNLAMESLLSLTSKSAGEWFKEELRKHGALDHIVDTVCSCIEVVSDDTTLLTDSTIENIKKVDRCLRVLENVTFTNEENQQYLISYKQSGLIKSVCSKKFLHCFAEFACQKVGEQNVFIDTTLVCILQTPQYVPLDFRFDILVLLFCHRFEIANKMEEQDFREPSTPSHSPDKSGEWRESDSGIEWVVDSAKKDGSTVEEKKNSRNSNDLKNNSNPNNLDDEETFTKALHRAGKHMENSIVASYVGLLLGCLIQDNSDFVEKVKNQLPTGNFEDMIAVLKKFLAFMNFTSVIGSGGTGGKSIAHVIEVLEAC
ncbi:hypothetical protein KUTeg_003208 [Tegillarca granosa]|uniref:WAPL domain-containing protein n=1 Tax=Tegillarca granosa TaxID=220873 RepID=A0ABQ9FQB7_TEGGR|nr:hypothetical protein KUTeg_003208 [Tegillarca granosa]